MPNDLYEIQPLAIPSLFGDNVSYEIPIYQRNYAWEAREIEQLIQDIADYAQEHPDKQYYIGTLVVSVNKTKPACFSTIDGQQRLTTLAILGSVGTHVNIRAAMAAFCLRNQIKRKRRSFLEGSWCIV